MQNDVMNRHVLGTVKNVLKKYIQPSLGTVKNVLKKYIQPRK